jgi:hypothetical protein
MSDPELSMAAASSSPSLPAADSNALTYAFLVHSQKTLTQNLPPRVDNKLLARQKRRRTRYVFFFIGASNGPSRVVRHQKLTITTPTENSPEDHAILESEYQINPKPDKLARTHIVNRVSLGEKEVQVRDAKTWSVHNLPAVRVADIFLVCL